MKQTTAAIVVLAGLAAATGQDTVKLPDPDFWVTSVWRPHYIRGSYRPEYLAKVRAAQARDDALKRPATWEVCYVLPMTRAGFKLDVTAKTGGMPTREEVRLALRMHMLKNDLKATRPPKEVQHLIGRYRRSELRLRSPSTTTRPSSARPTAPAPGRRRPRSPSRPAR